MQQSSCFCSLYIRYRYSHRKALWFSCPDLAAFTKTMHTCFQIPNTHWTSGWHSVNWVATDTKIQSPEMLNPKTLSAVQKWLNRSTCHLVSGLGWAEWSNSDAAICQITLTSWYSSCCWSLAISFSSKGMNSQVFYTAALPAQSVVNEWVSE